MKNIMKRRNKKGFTIVELVIVIGVIGILSAILIPTFVSLNGKAEEARLQSNLHNAFSMYAADAVDGKVGEDGAALAQKAQDQVKLSSDGTHYYKWSSSDSKWVEESPLGSYSNVTSDTNCKYLGFTVYGKN